MRPVHPAFPLLLAALAAGSLPGEGLRNGDFETIEDWLVHHGDRKGAVPDYSVRCADGGEQGFRIGRTSEGRERDGSGGAALAHPTFSCGGTENLPFCTITFRARFEARDGEKAELQFVDLNAIQQAFIPPGSNFATFRVSDRPRKALPWVQFSIAEGDSPGVQSTLCIDRVVCESTAQSETNRGAGITPLELPDAGIILFPGPLPPEQDARFSAPRDCNRNHRSDEDDIASGRSLDADSDGVPDECPLALFRRGDANADALHDLSDAIAILSFLFLGDAKLACEKSADADDSGAVDITDAVFLLEHLFLGGPAPPEPFRACDLDPTADALACRLPGSCLLPDGTFFGHQPLATAVVLVLDASSSAREGGCTERIAREAAAFLEALMKKGRAEFAIVAFDDKVHRLPRTGSLLPAETARLAEAAEFLRALPEPAGPDSCMRAGFAEALSIANSAAVVGQIEILFASRLAGACRGADFASHSRETLSSLASMNFRRHRIHAVGLFRPEQSARQSFLAGIAGLPFGSSGNSPVCE